MTFSVKFIILVKKSNILAIYKGIREDKSASNLAKPERKSWCSSKSVRIIANYLTQKEKN
jgi:hypothetical protein